MARGRNSDNRKVGFMSSLGGRIRNGRPDRDAEQRREADADATLHANITGTNRVLMDAMRDTQRLLDGAANPQQVHDAWMALNRHLADCSRAWTSGHDSSVPSEERLRMAVVYSDAAGILGVAGPLAASASARGHMSAGPLSRNDRVLYLKALDDAVAHIAEQVNAARLAETS